MKKYLSLLIIVLFTISTNAQGSDQTTVNIILSEVMNIEVANPTVNLTVDTPQKYISGTNTLMNNHVKINSTVAYEVKVAVNGDFTDGSGTIPANKVNLTLTNGSGGNSTPSFGTNIPLSTTETTVLSTNSGDLQRIINVDYTLEGGSHLLVEEGTYSTLLTYTIYPN